VSHCSRRTPNAVSNTLTGEYELESCEGRRKSGMHRKSKQQAWIDNESQEDILGGGHLKDVSRRNGVTAISDAGPLSQKGSFRSDRSDIPSVSHEEFGRRELYQGVVRKQGRE
jgi:hypothetical protein